MDAWFWAVLAPASALISFICALRVRRLIWQDQWDTARETAWAAVRRAL